MSRFLKTHGEALIFGVILTFTMTVVAPSMQAATEAKQAAQMASKD